MEVNGWKLYGHRLFIDQLNKLVAQVKEVRKSEPEGYESHPKAKFLATIHRLIRQTIPDDPTAAEFRPGNTLGKSNKHWFRAKFHGRYRLFFRFSTKHRIIVYIWLNDEKTLRKAGSKTDPYSIFESMLKRGNPPQEFEKLLKTSYSLEKEWRIVPHPLPASHRSSQSPSAPRASENRVGTFSDYYGYTKRRIMLSY